VQFEVPLPAGFTDIQQFQLSPDGRKLAFIASATGQRPPAIWIRSIDSSAPQLIAGTEGAAGVFWSPGSDFLGFQVGAQFKKIAVGGGPPQPIGTSPLGAFGYTGASWGSSGAVLVGSPRTVGGTLGRIDADGQWRTAAELDKSRGESFNLFPNFLPDGQHYFFVAQSSGTTLATYVATLDGKERRPLPGVASQVVYSSGYIVFRREAALMAQRFDTARLELSGEAFPIADIGYQPRGLVIPDLDFSASTAGSLAYRVRPTSATAGAENSELVWFDRAGKQLSVIARTGEYENPMLSPDGKYVAFQRGTPPDIWVLDIARGLTSRLTSDPSFDGFPLWSPDGRSIVFMSTRGGVANIYQRPFGVVGEESVLFKDDTVKVPGDLGRDGRYVAFDVGVPGAGQRDIWALPLTGDRKPIPITMTPFAEQAARISPDGRWIAYMSNESGEADMQLYVQSFPQPGVKQQVSTTGVVMGARWSRDGKELFYLAPGSMMMAVPFKANGDSFNAGTPVALFKAPILTGGGRREFDVAADGHFLMNVTDDKPQAARSTPITVVLNWAAGLKK
jgi:eukaryotic-like serine/threonine-protein kinase